MTTILIKNGHVIDPKNQIDGVMDILVRDGVVADIAEYIAAPADTTLDARDLVVTPGLVDLQVHFREPGREDQETLETGARAALRGGVTTAVAMPNTNPVADNQSVIEFILKRSCEMNLINIYPTGSITKGQKGELLAEMWELKQAGAVALTDDGADVEDPGLLRKAMEYARTHDMLIMTHCETSALTDGGVMHEGWVSTQLGLPGTPAQTEDLAVEKNVMLAKMTGARLHVLHNSTRGAVDAIRRAKEAGFTSITGEVSIQHAVLTDEECLGYTTNAKMYPPLRSREHVSTIVGALSDGTMDAITTDHAPHIEPDKLKPFADAAFGSTGLETSFAAMYTHLIQPGHLSLRDGIALMTHRPASVIRKNRGTLSVGAPADIAIFDLEREWVVDPAQSVSKGRNCVFNGKRLSGKAVHAIVNGELKMRDETIL